MLTSNLTFRKWNFARLHLNSTQKFNLVKKSSKITWFGIFKRGYSMHYDLGHSINEFNKQKIGKKTWIYLFQTFARCWWKVDEICDMVHVLSIPFCKRRKIYLIQVRIRGCTLLELELMKRVLLLKYVFNKLLWGEYSVSLLSTFQTAAIHPPFV